MNLINGLRDSSCSPIVQVVLLTHHLTLDVLRCPCRSERTIGIELTGLSMTELITIIYSYYIIIVLFIVSSSDSALACAV